MNQRTTSVDAISMLRCFILALVCPSLLLFPCAATMAQEAFHQGKLAALDAALQQAIAEGNLLGANVWVESDRFTADDWASEHLPAASERMQPRRLSL